jgi:hypothetical protein
LTGTGKGCVSNRRDAYYGNMAVLYAFVFCCDLKNRTIRYTVENDDRSLYFLATGFNISIQCPVHCSDPILICGKGHVKKQSQCHPDCSGPANFTLTIYNQANGIFAFQMKIHSDKSPDLNHDSGLIQTKPTLSQFR